jgi:ABC-type transport system involved in multi-copper enzyme maturation permease subunit
MRALKVIRVIARATVLESLRRRDVYVVLILAGLLMLGGTVFRLLGARDLETLLRDVSLTIVNVLSTIIAVMLSIRQMPEEIQRRTLYPLLARPIARWQLLLGKFAGAAAMSVAALLALAAIALLNLALCGVSVGPIAAQYVLLRVFCQCVVCAMAMALSLVVTPGAAMTLSLLLVIGAATFSSALQLLHEDLGPVGTAVVQALYYVLPHVDLFDLSRKVAHDWPPLPAWAILYLGGYALVYVLAFLGLGLYRFQRQAL